MYKIIVLYGCETWSLTFTEKQRLMVFSNKILRIFGAKRDEITGEWRKLHNAELSALYSSPNIIIISVLPNGRSFTANSGTKAAILPKGRNLVCSFTRDE